MMRMDRYSSKDFSLSAVSFHEQTLGAHNFINRAQTNTDTIRGYNLLIEILQGFASAPVLPFDDELRSQKVRVSTMDLRIASIALSRGLVLLTRNVRDFSKVPKLVTKDWTV